MNDQAWPANVEALRDEVRRSAAPGAAFLKTVFHEPWWLNAASGGNWSEAVVKSDGAIIARLPYITKRLLGVTGIGMPPLTHLLGPQLPVGEDRPGGKRPAIRELLAELISQLPAHGYFNQVCDPSFTDALPLYALGYDSGLKYTLQVAPASPDQLMQGIRARIRSDIRKAERGLNVDHDLAIDEFCRFFNAYTQANHKVWWSQRHIRQADALKIRVYEACRKADAGCLLAVRDKNAVLRGAIMLVWGNGVMYYLLTAHDAQPEGAGSIKLLLWESLKLASRRGMVFDFHGFPRPGAVNLLSGFGGVVRNRITVMKIPPMLQMARLIASQARVAL